LTEASDPSLSEVMFQQAQPILNSSSVYGVDTKVDYFYFAKYEINTKLIATILQNTKVFFCCEISSREISYPPYLCIKETKIFT
jgi:hypothetical protein